MLHALSMLEIEAGLFYSFNPHIAAKKSACISAVANHVNASTRVIGIGSGTTVIYCIDALKVKIAAENINIIACIPTSFQARQLILNAGLPLGDLNQHPLIDVTFDGADEIDSMRNLIKGGGGCHLQEKLIAVSSKELIIVADARKSSTHLGQNWKRGVPVEVIPNGLVYVTSELKKIGGKCTIREGSGKAGPVISENGNILVDCDFGIIFDVEGLEKKLDSIVGLVEHGLFSGMADRVYFGSEDGSTTVI